MNPTSQTVPIETEPAAPAPAEALRALWRSALEGDHGQQDTWRSTEGGLWRWDRDGVLLTLPSGQWCDLHCAGYGPEQLRALRNFIVEVSVGGNFEAAGLSFGPYKDFLVTQDGRSDLRHLQVEVDADAGAWAFRIDGALASRRWWDSGIRSTEDLINGTIGFKARNVERAHFQNFNIDTFAGSCRISVVVTCHRFAQRMRVALRAWCHQDAPWGEYEVLVVNPDSPDGTHEYLAAVARSYPHVRLREIQLPSDHRLNKGVLINHALRACRGDWVLLTDSDCVFPPNCVRDLVSASSQRRKIVLYGQRRHLSAVETDALISGRWDPVSDFERFFRPDNPRPPDNAPWGYCQFFPRSLMLQYSEQVNHYASSDLTFIAECRQRRIKVEQLPGLFCLHLDHPFAWNGTDTFL